MPITPQSLHASPNALAQHYTKFRVAERILLSGHSHQAWPDCGFDAQQQAWLDAANLVDDKWGASFERADRVRRGYARLLGEPDADIALAENTHELIVRLLSALPVRNRRRILTTDGEFHSIRRQVDRLAEEGVPVDKVDALPAESVAERLAERVDGRTLVVFISSVFFMNSRIVPNLSAVAEACRKHGATLVVDAYHHMNIVPFNVQALGLEDAYIVGAGYKYCQLGEGNGFMRLPKDCTLRPVITGWFSEFTALTKRPDGGVSYGPAGHRFAGATYDATANYRGARVFEFFEEQGLTPSLLRDVSQHQVGLLMSSFDALDLDPEVIDRDRTVALKDVGGFLALRSPHAGPLHAALKQRGIYTDFRGDVLRLGPAPYLSDAQLTDGITALGECVRSLPH
jgi:kynureninase